MASDRPALDEEIEVTEQMVEAALYLWPGDMLPLNFDAHIEIAKIYRAIEKVRVSRLAS